MGNRHGPFGPSDKKTRKRPRCLRCGHQAFDREEEAEGFRFIDDAHLLSNGKVVKVPPVGNRFKALPFFTSSVNIGDLPKFLSIFLSFTENVELDLFGWPLSEGEPIASVPVLIFEKIDYDGALHLRVGEALPGMERTCSITMDLSAWHLWTM